MQISSSMKQMKISVNNINFDGLIVNDTNPISASFTATVSTAGTISEIAVVDGGSGYVGNSTSVHISQPPVPMKVSPIATGIGSTAVATANITNGTITSVTVKQWWYWIFNFNHSKSYCFCSKTRN